MTGRRSARPAISVPPPNTRVQRTRSSASARHSPLTRSPLGGLIARLVAAAVVAALAASDLEAQARGDVAFLRKAEISLAELHPTIVVDSADPGIPPSPVPLTRRQIKKFRSIIVSAVARNIAAAEAAKGTEAVSGGAGCLSNEFEVTFTLREVRETATLHVRGGWMSGGPHVGLVNFSREEQEDLGHLLGVPVPCQ